MNTWRKIITVGLNPAIDRVIEVERFALGAHQTGRLVRRTGAGKSVNVARALATLGVPCVVTGFLGRENRRDFSGVLDHPLLTNAFLELPGATRENITLVDPVAGQETHIRDQGLAVDQEGLARLKDKLAELAGPDDVVVFTGSLPPGVSAADFARLLDACARLGARVAVDTSGRALRALVARELWLLKPNAAELSELFDRPLPDLEMLLSAASELARHVQIVLLSRGSEGAYLVTADRVLRGRLTIPIQRRNVVGCGDALLAGFLAAAWHGADPRTALVDAVACASASGVTFSPAEFNPQTFQELKANVEVVEV